ncbi:DUF3618 domain-containing protein [Streptomyces sp. NPDC056437]|uniref:DUF3618 domain-containing protein n=1 Tax=Streptomyces sp. NPDC056437 TaxID=3345816 RepID=UPI0036B29022
MTKPSPDKPSVASVDDLRRQVEGTREELGQTVAALAAKADIKSRVAQKKTQVTSHMQDRAAQARRQLTGSAHVLGDRLHDEAPQAAWQRVCRTGGRTRLDRDALIAVGAVAFVAILLIQRSRRYR